MKAKIIHYIETWRSRGYSKDIPDEVPFRLMQLGLAPSYQAVALAVLRNDLTLSSLGYSGKKTAWYGELKRMKFSETEKESPQMDLWR